MYQLRAGLLGGQSIIASRGKFLVITVVSHTARVKMEPVKVNQVIGSEKGKDLVVIKGFKFRLQNILADSMERWKLLHKVQ